MVQYIKIVSLKSNLLWIGAAAVGFFVLVKEAPALGTKIGAGLNTAVTGFEQSFTSSLFGTGVTSGGGSTTGTSGSGNANPPPNNTNPNPPSNPPQNPPSGESGGQAIVGALTLTSLQQLISSGKLDSLIRALGYSKGTGQVPNPETGATNINSGNLANIFNDILGRGQTTLEQKIPNIFEEIPNVGQYFTQYLNTLKTSQIGESIDQLVTDFVKTFRLPSGNTIEEIIPEAAAELQVNSPVSPPTTTTTKNQIGNPSYNPSGLVVINTHVNSLSQSQPKPSILQVIKKTVQNAIGKPAGFIYGFKQPNVPVLNPGDEGYLGIYRNSYDNPQYASAYKAAQDSLNEALASFKFGTNTGNALLAAQQNTGYPNPSQLQAAAAIAKANAIALYGNSYFGGSNF